MSNTLSDSALIELARGYVDAANAHDLLRIEPMLTAETTYESNWAGRHDGVARIMAMMRSFFAANPEVRWEANNYRRIGDGCVGFDFIMSTADDSIPGVERIFFGDDGGIRKIEVERWIKT